MNGNAEEVVSASPDPAKLLSGNALLQIHINVGRSLPKDGSKEFAPTNSWMEKKQIQSALDERKELLGEERVEKWGSLSSAVWNNKAKLAEVVRRNGKHFQHLGFEKEGRLYLYPEEALYLLETNCLELSFGGVPMSIQQGYSLLLGTQTGCNMNEYRTFTHLLRQGYRLLRFTSQQIYTKYERAIRLNQHSQLKRSHPASTTEPHSASSDPLSPKKPEIKHENLSLLSGSSSEKRSARTDNAASSSLESSSLRLDQVTALVIGEQDAHIVREINSHQTVSDENFRLGEKHSEVEKKDGKCSEELVGKLNFDGVDNSVPSSEEPQSAIANEDCLEKILPKENETAPKQGCSSFSNNKSGIDEQDASKGEDICSKSSHIEGCEEKDMQSEEGTTSLQDSATSKAIHIAENLMSLGTDLMRKGNKIEATRSEEDSHDGNLSVTLQSEIIKLLGAHFESSVSNEALSSVASSAADTILSHIRSNQDKKEKELCQAENDVSELEIFKNYDTSESRSSTKNDDTSASRSSISCQSPIPEDEASNASCQPFNGTKEIQSEETFQSTNQNVDTDCAHLGMEKDSSSGHTARDESAGSTCAQDDIESGCKESTTDSESLNLKRPLPIDEGNDCEAVLIKKPKSGEIFDSEIEILDIVPEKREVELVNLSDESSIDTVEGSNFSHTDDRGCIEVIDINDSSSDESLESASPQECSPIVHNSIDYDWDVERARILDSFPSMHKRSEIVLRPPNPDLLPKNVVPQRKEYVITRWKSQRQTVEEFSHDPPGSHQTQHFRNPFQSQHFMGPFQPQHAMSPYQTQHPVNPHHRRPHISNFQNQVFQQNNLIDTLNSLVQLVLGLTPEAYLPNQLWMQRNPWSAWDSPQNHFNHALRRGTPRRAYRHFSRRPLSRHSHFNSRGTDRFLIPIPTEAAPQREVEDSSGITHENFSRGRWRGRGFQRYHYPRKHFSRDRGNIKLKRIHRGRYFNPSKKNKHLFDAMRSRLENDSPMSSDSAEVVEISDNFDSRPIAPTTENLEEDKRSQTDESSSNESSNDNSEGSIDLSKEVKQLVLPQDCQSFESVFRTLQVIKEADSQCLLSTAGAKLLKPHFDLFSPTKPFKKGSPSSPDFHLCIMGCDEPVPDAGEIKVLQDVLSDNVPILFAIVSPDSISFIQFCEVSLPQLVADGLKK